MEHERIDISAKLGNDEGHPMGHKSANEMNIAAEPVQLSDCDLAF